MILSQEEINRRVEDSYELPNNVLEKVPHPIVSVRTSTYNHAPYIRQCIEGVLMQKTTFPIEYIIGEDYSSDETRSIVFDYAKKYPDIIRVVTADYNVGSKANGKRCIDRCRGKYMAICEGDDYWVDPLKLQKQVDFMENNPEYGMIHTNYQLTEGKIIGKRSFNESGDYLEDIINSKVTLATPTILLRKEIYDRIPKLYIDKGFRMGDLPMWIEVAAISKIKHLNFISAAYRTLQESASHSRDIDKQINFYKSVLECTRFYSDYFKIKLQNSSYNLYYESIIRAAFQSNNIEYADKYFKEAKTQKSLSLKMVLFYYATKFRIIRKILIMFLGFLGRES